MPWNSVRQVLLDRVVPLMRPEHRQKGEHWVDLLGRTENGPRLGACIVIDIGGAVDPQVFASILEHLDFTKEDAKKSACWAFDDAVRNHPDNRDLPDKSGFVCRSCFVADAAGDEGTYVRVLDLSGFITFIVNPNGNQHSTLDGDDMTDALNEYFAEDDDGEWEDIEREWSGTFGRVFVTSLGELRGLLKGVTGSGAAIDDALSLGELRELLKGAPNPVSTINDALGLIYEPPVTFVAVKYPDGFSEKCHQPTTLDVCWARPNWYVSHKNVDLWGRTHSCSGTARNVKERVHRKLPHLAGGFSGVHIGELKSPPAADPGKLLEEAFNRMQGT